MKKPHSTSAPRPGRAESPVSDGGSGGSGNAPEYSVSDLAGAIKRALEDGFGYVRLKGEISGYRGPHSSGHCYFALKDDKAKIDAVIWKGVFGRLRFCPEEGMEVIAQGRITTFPGSSKYQIVIEALEPAGAGALMALLEERKRRYAAAGLFDESRKKPRPFLPKVVGIVTSPTGAVIRDMLHGFEERFPTHVLVWPVRVQGEGSAAEVAAAIRGFNALGPASQVPRPDVLIVARGGGSLEDLWGFNEEAVVEAAAASTIPLISAVGHETDWTLIDLVADARAPTPTKAAEWAVPKYADLITGIEDLGGRQRLLIRRLIGETRTHLKAAARGLPKLESLIAFPRQRFDEADKRLSRALTANTRAHALRLSRVASRLTAATLSQRLIRADDRLTMVRERLRQAVRNRTATQRREIDALGKLLRSLGYKSVLARGFALVRDESGKTVRLAAPLHPGDGLSIEFADGRIAAEVKAETGPPLEPPSDPGVKRRSKPKGGPGTQGSLF